MTAVDLNKTADGRLDARSAARYLGLAPQTLANLRCQGTGPEFVKRGRIFYFVADLDNWLTSARVRSTAQARYVLEQDRRGAGVSTC